MWRSLKIKSVMHGNLKFLHMTIFSPRTRWWRWRQISGMSLHDNKVSRLSHESLGKNIKMGICRTHDPAVNTFFCLFFFQIGKDHVTFVTPRCFKSFNRRWILSASSHICLRKALATQESDHLTKNHKKFEFIIVFDQKEVSFVVHRMQEWL